MNKPITDYIPLSVPSLRGRELEYIKECIDGEYVSSVGSFVDRFENELADYAGVKFAVACINGTAALHIALILAGVGTGDAVIVPTITFIAPINAVRYVRAEPIFMDCDDFFNIDVNKVREFCRDECKFVGGKLLNKKTGSQVKAIIPVHVFGNPVDLEPLMDIAREYNLKVVEDAAESLGSSYTGGGLKGRKTGAIGDLGCYSFNGNKIITTGGGGMIVTNSAEYAQRAKYLIAQAKDDEIRYIHNEIGYNLRLTNIQAAIGVAQLESLAEYVEIKKNNYWAYKNEIDIIPGLHLAETPEYAHSNHWFYGMRIDKDRYGMSRKQLMEKLAENKIQTRPIWYLNHLQKPYRNCQSYKIKKAFEIWEETLNIPCSVNLRNEDIARTINVLKNNLNN